MLSPRGPTIQAHPLPPNSPQESAVMGGIVMAVMVIFLRTNVMGFSGTFSRPPEKMKNLTSC